MAGDLEQWFSKLGSKQREHRMKGFFIDQLDRRYFAWKDKDNQRPIAEFELTDKPLRKDGLSRFVTAPWNPPMAYIEWPDADTTDFKWKFEQIASELAGNTAEWYSLAAQMAEAAKLPVPDIGGVCDSKLIALLGPPPLSPEIPIACEAGEPWIIGVRDARVNRHLQTVLNMGRAITSTLALDVIRKRVLAYIESDGGRDANLGDLEIPGVPSSVSVPTVTDFGHREPVRGAEPDTAFDTSAIKYPEFLASGRKQGLARKEIDARWALHKASVAPASVPVPEAAVA